MESYSWQLYDKQGQPLKGKGAQKQEVVIKGLLHGSAHLWLWRPGKRGPEVLLQKRSGAKLNWPGRLDKSAGGHIMRGEEPLRTIIRKAQEELTLAIAVTDVHLIGVTTWSSFIEDTDFKENEFQWIYLSSIQQYDPLPVQPEVSSTVWMRCDTLNAEISDQQKLGRYVPYTPTYFQMLCDALAREHTTKST